MPVTRWRVAARLCILAAAVVFPAAAVHGQDVSGKGAEEVRLLREAAAREAAGDFAGAERILVEILENDPGVLSALLALERVYRVQGRLADVLGPVDRLLDADPQSTMGHQLRVQTLAELGRSDEFDEAAEAWMAATPKLETPYREIARVYAERGLHARAAEILERGRSRVGRADALALELGEMYALLGDDRRAVREWERAIGPDGRGASLVRRRLGTLPDGGASLTPGLIDALTRRPTTPRRMRVAVDFAIEAGLGERAETIARAVQKELAPREREVFLVEIARRADGSRLLPLAYWAYGQLIATEGPDQQLLALRTRHAELALAVGDTATARAAFAELESAYAEGSPERRQAAAFRIELTARDGDVDGALAELQAFRDEYGDAPELDRLAATIGEALLRRGDVSRAERVLASAKGPRGSLLRGRLALRNGDVAQARLAFMTAAPGLEGPEATETLMLVTLLGRLTSDGGKLMGAALAQAMQGDVPGAVALLMDESGPLEGAERAGILDYAAGLADRAGLAGEAERIRRVIVAEHADSPEAPAALLALGRALAARPGGVAEARAFLERLVLEYPRSALVPQARRELDRLQRRVPKS